MIQKGVERISNEMVQALLKANHILFVCHVSPDGDTVGSAMALQLALQKLNKKVICACADKIPDMLLFLKGAEQIIATDDIPPADLAMAVDISDEKRMGSIMKHFEKAMVTCQIDHHCTNPLFADINAVDGEACATGLLAYELINKLNVQIDMEIARCLYTAIATDTGNFSFSSTSAEAFSIMADLMAYPIHINAMNRILFRQRSRAQTMLLARALKSLAFYQDDCVAGMTLSRSDFEKCGALPEHSDAVVNFGIDTIGIQVAFLARETEDGDIKFSLRALPPADVSRIAKTFGGGGHALAAGCTLEAPMDEAVARVMAEIQAHLAEI